MLHLVKLRDLKMKTITLPPSKKILVKILLGIAVGGIVVALIARQLSPRNTPVSQIVTPPIPEGNQAIVAGDPLTAELAGLSFLDFVFSQTARTTVGDATATTLTSFLTPTLATQFTESKLNPNQFLLKLFTVTTLPTTFSETDFIYDATSAQLTIELSTTKTTLQRTITLEKIGDAWLIAGVSAPTE